MNAEIVKYQEFAEELCDTEIIKSSNPDEGVVSSNELRLLDENVNIYMTLDTESKKVKCFITLTEVPDEYVISLMKKIGLKTTEQNVDNYKRDPTMIENFWNKKFMIEYKEICKALKKAKITVLYKEKLKPAYKKTRNNEVLYE